MELPEELQTLIHHVLHRHKFYRLEISNYHDILDLLSQPRTNDPYLIQLQVFRGIVAFNMAHKDQIAPVLANPLFSHVSVQSKTLLHRVLHQFHFLNCIRAYEMFQERFQQPASLTQPHGLQGLPFDDQLEKARLHYMYYGPYSVYSMGSMMQQQPNYSQNYFAPSVNMYQSDEQPQSNRIGKLSMNNQGIQEPDRAFSTLRGRPPKEKRRQIEKTNSLKISKPIRQYLLARYDEDSLLQQREEQLQHCVCRGFLNSPHTFTCPKCHSHFHVVCTNFCLGCGMRERDPFKRVVETIGLYFLDWWGQDYNFEEQINMKSLEKVCSTGRFEVMISCVTAQREDITWPDGAVLTINNQKVFEVPSLLIDHNTANRKDTSQFISSYIFDLPKTDHPPNFQKIKLNFDANHNLSPQFRDNRKDIFLLGLFLVEKVSIETLLTTIIAQSRTAPTINPLEQGSNRDEELQVDHLAISCFDPYSRGLIQTPVRGRHCLHFNCFDLQTFLTFQHHSRYRNWRCPICGLDARNLIVDKFQLRLIEEIRDLPRLPSKVTFYLDGKINLEEGQVSAEAAMESQ